MMQCIAVDDEPLALALLEDNISKVPYLHLAAKCEDAFEATKILQTQPIDLVFIDIQMPGLTGIQFIESLVQKPMVILITAYKQYALDGYTLDVVDYLVKPVPVDRFLKACNKAMARYEIKNTNNNIVENVAAEFFFINVDYSLLKIMFNDVLWIEGLKDYIKIYLKSKAHPIVARMSVKAIESQLPESKFVRIHKSYIISIDNITAIRKTSVFLKEHEFPVGETYRDVISKLTGKNLY